MSTGANLSRRLADIPRMSLPPKARAPIDTLISVALAALSVAWSIAVFYVKFDRGTLPGPAQLISALPYLMPAVMLAALLIRPGRGNWLDQLSWLWTLLVMLAALLVPKVAEGSTATLIALPAIAAASMVAKRWPTIALGLAVVMSCAYGTLEATWSVPVGKLLALGLAALWVSSLVGLLVSGSRPVRPSAGLLLFVAYLVITAIMVLLASNRSVANYSFKNVDWYMMIVPLLAWAGWRRDTHDRMAKLILLCAIGAGAYAILRIIIGPSHKELVAFTASQYNFDPNGKLKPGGSFASAQDMGTWMALIVPFCFAQALARRDWWRLVAALAVGVCAISAVESSTRIAFAGMLAGLVLVVVLYASSRGFSGVRIGTTAVAVVAGAAALVAALVITGNNASHSYSALLHPGKDESVVLREAKWSQALSQIRSEPFGFGVGTAGTGEANASLYSATGDTSIDNGYLRIALEQGLVIMIVFCVALGAMLLAIIRAGLARGESTGATIAIGGAGALLSYAVVMMAEDASADPRALAVWVPVGLAMAVALDARRPVLAPDDEPLVGRSTVVSEIQPLAESTSSL